MKSHTHTHTYAFPMILFARESLAIKLKLCKFVINFYSYSTTTLEKSKPLFVRTDIFVIKKIGLRYNIHQSILSSDQLKVCFAYSIWSIADTKGHRKMLLFVKSVVYQVLLIEYDVSNCPGTTDTVQQQIFYWPYSTLTER